MKLIKDLGIVKGRRKGIYECSKCLTHIERRTSHVKCSKTTLCKACIMSEKMTTHGKSNTRLFRIWQGMKDRCSNPNNPEYRYYGGKGIRVCDEWRNEFETFYQWSVCNGYSDNLVLDKDIKHKDSNTIKIYSPQTCI